MKTKCHFEVKLHLCKIFLSLFLFFIEVDYANFFIACSMKMTLQNNKYKIIDLVIRLILHFYLAANITNEIILIKSISTCN